MKDDVNGLAMDKRSAESYLAETSDGGETWTLVEPTGAFYGYDIAYIPGTDNMWISTGAASGASGASYSVDGGHSWVDYPEVAGIQLLDCDFIEGGIGWAGSFNEDEFTGGMYKYIPGEAEPAFDIDFTDGTGFTITIKNVGTADATNVEYSIIIEGGLIILPAKEFSDTIASIPSGDSSDILLELKGIGFGILTAMPSLTIIIDCDEEVTAEKSDEFRLFLTKTTLQ
jgi:uncharacterized repeat protein (TIGR01451 family)